MIKEIRHLIAIWMIQLASWIMPEPHKRILNKKILDYITEDLKKNPTEL